MSGRAITLAPSGGGGGGGGGILNPIGVNMAAGGTADFIYEGFPIFQDRFREANLYPIGSGTPLTPANFDANGWPTIDCQCAFSGGNVNLSWMAVGSNYFSCGYTSKGNGPATQGSFTTTTGGTEILSTINASSTISNIAYNTGTKAVTFHVTLTTGTNCGWQVTNTTSGYTNAFSYLPAYNSNTAYSSTSLFTSDFVAFYSQFPYVRWMFPQNSWYNSGLKISTIAVASGVATATIPTFSYPTGTYLVFFQSAASFPDVRSVSISNGATSISWTGNTTAAATALWIPSTGAARNTPSNTKCHKGWNASGCDLEGYPFDWWIDAANACNNGAVAVSPHI